MVRLNQESRCVHNDSMVVETCNLYGVVWWFMLASFHDSRHIHMKWYLSWWFPKLPNHQFLSHHQLLQFTERFRDSSEAPQNMHHLSRLLNTSQPSCLDLFGILPLSVVCCCLVWQSLETWPSLDGNSHDPTKLQQWSIQGTWMIPRIGGLTTENQLIPSRTSLESNFSLSKADFSQITEPQSIYFSQVTWKQAPCFRNNLKFWVV